MSPSIAHSPHSIDVRTALTQRATRHPLRDNADLASILSLTKLRKSLPELNSESLNFFFTHVYDAANGVTREPEPDHSLRDHKLPALLDILKSLQMFNHHHRIEEAFDLYEKAVLPSGLNLQSNSSGSELWLAMLLAVKDIYGLSNNDLTTTIRKITIRN